ncbi:MAG: CHAT domain-containing protein, partial [Pseudonocardia sp.]
VQLDELSPAHATDARLLAGRLALDRGRTADARRHLRSAARARTAGSRARAAGWLAQATLCEIDGRWRAMLGACDQGLRSLDVLLDTVGSTELRVLATARRAELVRMALRCALGRGDARGLLTWSERARATVLAVPPVRPPGDDGLVSELAALRNLVRRLEAGDHAGHAAPVLLRERRRLESAVRQRVLRTPGTTVGAARSLDVDALLGALGGCDLLELVDVDGELHAVVAGRGAVRTRRVGPVAAAERSLAHALFALRREGARPDGRASLDLDTIGARLEAALLGDAVALLRDGPVVVVPTSRLHAVPWNMLPALRGRPTTVAPSATTWLRARNTAPPPGARVVLVGGPRLSTGAEEVHRLAARYPQADVLTGGSATAERVLTALDGAWLAHVAAHGTFRADSPSFSALELDDGPLTGYDLERLHRAPHRIVLSSCNSAVGAPSGADELIGLVSVLIALGAAGVVASVVPVDDPATVALMLALHEGLCSGAPPAEALHRARTTVGGTGRARAAADAFVALGT